MAPLFSNRVPGHPFGGNRLVLLLVLALVGLPGLTWAQRHDKRMTGLGVVYGKTDTGRFAEGSWTRYVSDNTYLRLGVSLARPQNPLRAGSSSAYGLSLTIAPLLFHVREIAYVHVLAGGLLRYERTNEDDTAPDHSGVQQHFYGGPLLGLETDVFLGNRVSVVGTLQKAIVFPDGGLARWPGYYGVGLRYHLW
jgi:hypothetical protein